MAEGDIGSVIDTLEFEATACYEPFITHIAGDWYAIVYRGVGNDGFLISVSIDSDGDIGAAVHASLEFDAADGLRPHLIQVSGLTWAIVSTRTGAGGWICTPMIWDNGDISGGVLDVVNFAPANGYMCRIIHIFGEIYAIVYKGAGDDGFVCTISIAADGDIGAAVIENFEFAPTDGIEPKIIHISGETYAIVYQGTDSDGFVCTISIAADGDIGAAVIDTLEFDTGFCESPDIIHISGDVYAVAYKGVDSDGWLVTFTIDSAGNIGAAVIDSFEFDAGQAANPHIRYNSRDTYSIVYTGPDSDGFLVTVSIDSDGNIGAAVLDSFEFETVECDDPEIIHISGSIYAIVYKDTDDKGVIKTIGIETPAETAPKYMPLMGIG